MMMGNNQYAQTYAKMKSGKQKNKGVIFIEDISDKAFWEKIATQHIVQLYSENGQAITGKSKLLQICSSNQLIAVDSDFDWVCPNHRDESALCSTKKDFILQTYAHSRENLVLSPEYLHDVLNQNFKVHLDNHENRIQEIMQKLAECWFEPYRKFLFLMNHQFAELTHDDWINATIFQGKESQEIALQLDFTKYQERLLDLDKHLNQKITNQNQQQNYQKFCADLTNLGFDTQHVYGFIRGHDWEDKFVFKIISEIYSQRIKTEMMYAKQNFQDAELKNKREQIHEKFSGMKQILHNHFYQSYFSSAHAENFFIQKIVQDYQRIIGNH